VFSGSAPLGDEVDTVAKSAAEVDVDSILDVVLNARREIVLPGGNTECNSLRTTPRRTANIGCLCRLGTEEKTGKGREGTTGRCAGSVSSRPQLFSSAQFSATACYANDLLKQHLHLQLPSLDGT